MKKLAGKIILTIIIMAVVVMFAGCGKKAEGDDGPKVVMQFAMISDIHLQTNDRTSEENFRKAVAKCKELAGGKLDAVAICGDLVDITWYSKLTYEDEVVYQNSTTRQEQLDYLKSVMDETIDEGTQLIYCLGNHDMATFYDENRVKYTSSTKYYETLKGEDGRYFEAEDTNDYTGLGEENDLVENGLKYYRIGKCHFLTVDVQEGHYWIQEGSYTEIQIEWLDKMLEYITTTYENEPIYLLTHNPVEGTITYSSGTWCAKDLIPVLEKYPDVITFTGHIHMPCYSEMSISQDRGFTCVESSSVKYTYNNYYTEEEFDILYSSNITSSSQGLLVKVYESGETAITRIDFTNDCLGGEDWVIPAFGSENHNKVYTTQAREALNTAPYFAEDTKLTGETCGSYLNIKFTPATSEKYNMWCYLVKSYDSSGTLLKSLKVDAGNALKDEINLYSATFVNTKENIEYVEITPVDAALNEGEAIVIRKENFTSENTVQRESYVGTSKLPGELTIDGYNFATSGNFYTDGEIISNKNSMTASGNMYFDAYTDKYEYSYRIKNLCLNKANVSNGNAYEAYRVGTTLATFYYNGRIFSLCAYIDLGTYNFGTQTRNDTDTITYVLFSSASSCQTYSSYKVIYTTKLSSDLNIKERLKSEEGDVLLVKRNGSEFTICLGDDVLDVKNLSGKYRISNNLCVFHSDTKATFGISCMGGEADFCDFEFSAE